MAHLVQAGQMDQVELRELMVQVVVLGQAVAPVHLGKMGLAVRLVLLVAVDLLVFLGLLVLAV